MEGSGAAVRAAALIDDLEVHAIGGDHRSAIELPHVATVAGLIRRLEAPATLVTPAITAP